MNMHPNYSVETPKILYIDRYGYMYPDCKTYKTPSIAHITESNCFEKVVSFIFKSDEEKIFNMITVELSSLCHAKCLYCFQEDGFRGEKYKFFDELMAFLEKAKTYWLFFSGGEILDQPDAMNFIKEYKIKNPSTWVHLKTNGNANLDKLDFVNNFCNSIMVSFNGFTTSSCDILMDVELSKTVKFCEEITNNGKTNLCVKFLNSPVCINEIPDFLEWSISIRAKAIAFQTVYQYNYSDGKCNRESHMFGNLNSEYWNGIYNRIAFKVDNLLEKNKAIINTDVCNIATDKVLFDLLKISDEHKKMFRTDGVYIIE